MTQKKQKPLSQITVIDLSRLLPGAFCSLILADLGARVIKIEDRSFPDYLRDIPPKGGFDMGAMYEVFNRGKESLSVKIKSKEGQKILTQLIKRADVLLESFRPGVLKRLGLPISKIKKINPKIIVTSISGYGQKNSMAQKAGHDLNYVSLAGMMTSAKMPLVQLGDLVGGGLCGALSVMAGLFQRLNTKKGMHIDVSMTHSMMFMNLSGLFLSQFESVPNLLAGTVARYRMYRTKDDQWMSLAALEDKFWNLFCDLAQKEQWKDPGNRFPDFSPEIHQEVENLFRTKTKKEWTQWSHKLDICLTPVLEPIEVIQSSLFKEAKTSLKLKQKIYPTYPLKMDSTPLKNFIPPQKRGAQSSKILKELGYKPDEIRQFKKTGIVE